MSPTRKSVVFHIHNTDICRRMIIMHIQVHTLCILGTLQFKKVSVQYHDFSEK